MRDLSEKKAKVIDETYKSLYEKFEKFPENLIGLKKLLVDVQEQKLLELNAEEQALLNLFKEDIKKFTEDKNSAENIKQSPEVTETKKNVVIIEDYYSDSVDNFRKR